MIATNSSWLPEVMMDRAAKICTGFVAPSAWAASVIERYSCGRPVYVYPHGVDERFRPGASRAPLQGFRVLHLASTHFERKGTKELIIGWGIALGRGHLGNCPTLKLIADGPKDYFQRTIQDFSNNSSIELVTRRDFGVEAMRDLYLEHDLVCQPSRGEGFGMVPLEARACGVPAVMTTCTGHEEHAATLGVVRVKAGPEGPVDDGPGAMAPIVLATDVADSLAYAARNIAALRDHALDAAYAIRKRWSWERVTGDFLSQYGKELGLI
jgi:glycosyltransferase involved in cell wall biosynthesis